MIYIEDLYTNETKEKYYKKVEDLLKGEGRGNKSFKQGNIEGVLKELREVVPNGYKKYFSVGTTSEKFKKLILMPPDAMKDMVQNSNGVDCEMKNIKRLKLVYTRQKIMGKKLKGEEENINRFLIRELGLTVCPYCNRNYINNRGNKFSAQMDHFYSKDEFPWLAVSLYNLIPSCGACNHIKGTKALNVHPFIKSDVEDNEVKFSYRQTTSDDVKVIISTTTDARKGDIGTIKLEEAYSIHNLDVRNMLLREEKYSKKYREELRQLLQTDGGIESQLSLTDDEIDRMIYGDVIFEEDIKNVSLGKFRKDIYQEIKSFRDY
ncbi:TPA: hypothetical protein VB845_000283 [Streptococcus suis]|nr:hypothetical protein [Streptococcus suis]